MHSKRRYILHFLTSYLAVLIPVLLVSLWVSGNTMGQLQSNTAHAVQERVDQAAEELSNRYTRYHTSAVCLSIDDTLSRNFESYNYQRYSAIQLLDSVSRYDSSILHLFANTRGNAIFSSQGYSAPEPFFSRTLALTEASVARINSVLNQQNACVTWLNSNGISVTGYLLFHYPAFSSNAALRSFNFLIHPDELEKILHSISDSDAYTRLTFADGTMLTLHETAQEMTVISDLPEAANLDAYSLISVPISVFGAQMDVYYNASELYRPVYTGQWINMLILMLALIVSTALSLYLSTRRAHNVNQLYAQAHGMPIQPRYTGEYAFIGQLMGKLQSEISTLGNDLRSYRNSMRQQAASLILSGSITDHATANQLLQACDVEFNEEYFFVICAAFEAHEAQWAQIAQAFPDELACRLDVQGRGVLALIRETPNLDSTQKMRYTEAERLIALLHHAGVNSVRCGASKTHQKLSLANLALREAAECLEAEAFRHQQMLCFDALIGSDEQLPLDDERLRQFRHQLRQGDFSAALQSFDEMLSRIDGGRLSDMQSAYWRYKLLQTMQTAALESSGNQALYESLLSIDAHDAKVFAQEIRTLLARKPAVEIKKTCPWERIEAYIDGRYTDPDLSAQEVADVAGVNKAHLSAIFKENVGKTYIEYVSWVRLEKARELLTTTDMTVGEIVSAVGYYDHSSFRRKFKAQYGMSLNDFRDQYKQEE